MGVCFTQFVAGAEINPRKLADDIVKKGAPSDTTCGEVEGLRKANGNS